MQLLEHLPDCSGGWGTLPLSAPLVCYKQKETRKQKLKITGSWKSYWKNISQICFWLYLCWTNWAAYRFVSSEISVGLNRVISSDRDKWRQSSNPNQDLIFPSSFLVLLTYCVKFCLFKILVIKAFSCWQHLHMFNTLTHIETMKYSKYLHFNDACIILGYLVQCYIVSTGLQI